MQLLTTLCLVNLFTRPLYETPGGKVIVSFDILVDAGEFAGGSVYLANGGFSSITQRGPELRWSASGELTSVGADGDETALLLSYPRNVWQSVRLEVDLVTDTYNVYWAESGTSLQQIGTHLAFRSGSLSGLDRFTIARFSVDPVVRASVDNVSVEESLPEPLAILTDDGDFGFRSNQFGFNFAGPAGQTVAVEGSTNLLDWVALSTNTFGSVPLYFSDPDSGTLGRRFYRLRGVQ